ncbi:MAG TPA: PP2C family protein-serine/threonine phosphatase [Bacteroidales bacterium]|nr:PP2C family protein-serine/threonine phosphatase [Bacteroidales bacterium]HRR94150.1 PP2C family protein-serine/threonine phosphatase [Bacteroidales bacterium]HRT89252.1 PP2C family protein-serine/threonine phosphatase [Bacteroidales bacterium]
MEEKGSSRERLKISKFKLDALLDITLSINANLPVAQLLEKYDSILRNRLGIGKIMIFKLQEKWECILNAGFPVSYEKSVNVEEQLMPFTETAIVTNSPGFEGVDIIVPVYNNLVPLAFVFIGDIEEEGEGMSPVLKHLNFIQTISSIIIVAIENIRLFRESLKQEAMKKELELASRMQMMLIPHDKQLPSEGKIIVSGFYFPHYEVGGDYYDCITLSDNQTGFCIADVSGKGISAAILMSNFQASLRALFTGEIELADLISRLNRIVVANAAGEKFITFFVARYDHITGVLEYVNAAHNPPVFYDTVTGETLHLSSSCVGIGMLDEIPFVKTEKVKVKNHSKVVCYTDGLSELKDENGEDIGTRLIIKHISNSRPVKENISLMLGELGIPDNNPGLFDDVSIIVADLF